MPTEPLEILRAGPFLRFDRQTWTGHLVDEVLASAGPRCSDELELNSMEAIVELVRQGFGVSIVPQLANVQWSRDRALRMMRMPGVDGETARRLARAQAAQPEALHRCHQRPLCARRSHPGFLTLRSEAAYHPGTTTPSEEFPCAGRF